MNKISLLLALIIIFIGVTNQAHSANSQTNEVDPTQVLKVDTQVVQQRTNLGLLLIQLQIVLVIVI